MTTTPADPELPIAADDEKAAERGWVNVHALTRGNQLEVKNALVGAAVGERVSVTRALVRGAIGGRSVEIRQGGAGVVATAGGATITQGGAQTILTTGAVTVRQGGSGIALARSITVDNGLVIFGITPRLEIANGGRVVFGPAAALAIVGAVAGLAAIAAVLRATRAQG
jgi:hypothetical protein